MIAPQPQNLITDDLDALLDVLPPRVSAPIYQRSDQAQLLEIVLDLGRKPEARYTTGEVVLNQDEVTEAEPLYVVSRIGAFGDDNRAGIERTLHRISCIRNRTGRIVGLTCRVGRAVFGTIKIIEDLVRSGKSILLLGRPGVGKTTMLREVARVLSDDLGKRVVVVDTSNEIAGDGDIPHPAIGHARRMQVATPSLQHAVMIEAVENHMPEVIIIDEIGTELEAMAARTIAERGVQLVGTAHGNSLENLIMNPTLADLVGGIQSVTLGDEEARRRGTQKSVLERKAPPTFDAVVEIQHFNQVAVHEDVAKIVDAFLRGKAGQPEVRELTSNDEILVKQAASMPMDRRERRPVYREERSDYRPDYRDERRSYRDEREYAAPDEAAEAEPERPQGKGKTTTVYPFGVSRARVEQVVRGSQLPLAVSDRLEGADALITSRNYFRRRPQTIRDAEAMGVPIYVLKNHTGVQLEQGLMSISEAQGGGGHMVDALREAEDASHQILTEDEGVVDLNPQNAYIRRLQHQVAQRYNLRSRSTGREPWRRVRIYRGSEPSFED